MKILQICVLNTKHDYFSYYCNDKLPAIGARVLVPFGKHTRLGVMIAQEPKTVSIDSYAYELKEILTILDLEPILSLDLLQLCRWLASYYQVSLAQTLALAIPKRLRSYPEKNLQIKEKDHDLLAVDFSSRISEPILNQEQQQATNIINSYNDYRCFLLQGVTGSGKTEVYLQIITKFLAANKQILVIVPEIGLTPQLLQRFKQRFKIPMALLHSHLTERQRFLIWHFARENKLRLIIGTRSAIFTPLPQLGLIIIDEEHDASLKQMDSVYYCGRSTALMRAYHANIPIILGSATPSLESLYNVQLKKFTLLNLNHRALTSAPLFYQLVDLRNLPLQHGLAEATLQKITHHLAEGNQVLIFINRRGFAPVLFCPNCNWIADCDACDSHLTIHKKINKLICHHCGIARQLLEVCKQCQHHQLQPVGLGTQRLAEFLATKFAQAKVLRVDRDAVMKKGELENNLQQIQQQKVQLIIGTQMLAKGHHFPRLTMVVILDTDNSFYNHDFRALEHLGQLLTQVAGRAGRAQYRGEVILQTFFPHHPLLNLLIREGYPAFAQALLATRHEAQLPPYYYIAILRAEDKSALKVENFLRKSKKYLDNAKLVILGPAPAPLARKANQHRMQLFLKSTTRQGLQLVLTKYRQWLMVNKIGTNLKWQIDVDPTEM